MMQAAAALVARRDIFHVAVTPGSVTSYFSGPQVSN